MLSVKWKGKFAHIQVLCAVPVYTVEAWLCCQFSNSIFTSKTDASFQSLYIEWTLATSRNSVCCTWLNFRNEGLWLTPQVLSFVCVFVCVFVLLVLSFLSYTLGKKNSFGTIFRHSHLFPICTINTFSCFLWGGMFLWRQTLSVLVLY